MKKTDLIRVWYLLYCVLHRSGYKHAKWLKRHDAFHSMGDNCFFQPFKLPADAKLISMGDNVVVASNVDFICHDVIHHMLNHMPNSNGNFKTYFGKVIIGNNVFIGSNTTVLANVTIGQNTIIAAGSLVNSDVPEGKIVGGVPIRTIGTVDELSARRREYSNTDFAKMDMDGQIECLWSMSTNDRK